MRQEGELFEIDPKPEPVSVIKKKNKNAPLLDVQGYILSLNILAIYGISEVNALPILAEVGTDMRTWTSAKHFVSWLNLCPNNKISGGKVIRAKSRTRPARPSEWQQMPFNAVIIGWGTIFGE